MKKYISLLPLLLLFLITGCSSDDSTTQAPLAARNILNVPYGPDPQQSMDVYLPEGRDENTKVIVLVHGGAWTSGSKADVAPLVPVLQQRFPNHAVVNINYRLATETSPALPKQTDDIEAVLDYLETSDYEVSDDYAFIGFSAGAHLSMLYGYAHDTDHDVKAIVNVVGPADFTDPDYLSHDLYPIAALYLTGTSAPTMEQIEAISPASHITGESAPTLTFYGGQDPLVPASQGPRLKAKLDEAGVYNEFNFYPDGGHADWDATTFAEVYNKVEAFLQARF
ncbi:alpha/beta hydrolase [Flavobacterium sp. MFBS3-15]|uniref:alpha/beta hydrolase n=1 Tax=Flavobacterium sp. MFBS3-15 TaxID=2989816 RepID=UPI0022368ABE|nr:alpha/beta hydrolase [Flavobacterium sp. MFBS3-15]MCW4467581.1 alpha/beta hydrolase [Flavobacterium sp. MFBS3-15]